MVLSRVKLIVQIGVVISIAVTAGWLLYTDSDPDLSTVPFEPVSTTPTIGATAANNTAPVPARTDAVVVVVTPSLVTTNPTPVTREELRTASRAEVHEPVSIQIIGPDVHVSCALDVMETATVQAVMQRASDHCGFSYTGKNYAGLGFFVEEIAGLQQDQARGYYWIYSVNGQVASLGVSRQTVTIGDNLQWHYQAEY